MSTWAVCCPHLCGRACFTVVVTLLTVMKGIVGGEHAQTYGLGLSLGWCFFFLLEFCSKHKSGMFTLCTWRLNLNIFDIYFSGFICLISGCPCSVFARSC